VRILIITDMAPYPPIAGTPLRVYNLLQRISREHEVWLATFVRTPDEARGISHIQEFCCQGVETASLQRLGAFARPASLLRHLLTGTPPDLRLYYSEELVDKVRHLVSKVDFDIVQIENSYMAMYLEVLPREIRSKTLLDFIDIVFSKYDRIYRLEPKTAKKLRLRLHSRMMRWWEPRYAERFGLCATVSEADRRLLLAANPCLQVEVVPNGVDVQFYQPLPYESTTPALVFVGNMAYRPNIDAVAYFCQEVLPRVRRVIADAEMWIVGIDPGPEVRQLHRDGVHVTGRVDDVRPYYRRSAACVVPLRAGGGTRLKILEAMALGRPVISTTIGCEGLDVVDGEHLFIADDPEVFADKTIRLLTDETLRQHLIDKARQMVVTHYDWDVIARRLMQVYSEMARRSDAQNKSGHVVQGCSSIAQWNDR
jgi:sugar transferase (PEP-CTERM/EpsH1 system associated)